MTTNDGWIAAARRLGHRLHRDPVPGEDRGPADDADVLWPVGSDFSLQGATEWLNSPPLTGADLRGHVVLVNFWTFTCINWLRQLPYIRAWEDAYRSDGLMVVGVHSPEFSFEHDVGKVRRAADQRSIRYPIAIDNHFAVWRSFHNHYWPALYLVDAGGRLRHHSFGEGGYEETEEIIRRLLAESGAAHLGPEQVPVQGEGVEAAAQWDSLRSAETYLGSERTSGFASSPGVLPDRPISYGTPSRLRLGHWALSGRWTVRAESSALREAGGRLACRFEARDLHLVMAPPAEGPVRFRILLDGRAPGADHGLDVDTQGRGTLSEPRLHQLVRRRGPVDTSTLEIEFLGAGVQAYVLTFG